MMGMFLECKVAVNFVRNHINMVLFTNFSDPTKLLQCPYPAHRVVGTAKDEQLYLLLHDFLLKVLKVNAVASIPVNQRIFDYQPVIIPNHTKKRIIHRRLDQHRIAGLGQSTHRHGKSKHHAGGLYQPLRLGLPAEPPGKPGRNGGIIVRFYITVTENTMLHRSVQGLQNRLRRTEIHIRHPQREDISGLPPLHSKVILQTIRIFAINDGIKVILYHGFIPPMPARGR